MKISSKIKKILIKIEDRFFTILRYGVIFISYITLVFIIYEKFEDNYSDYPWKVEGLSWNYFNEEYYKAANNLNLIELSIILTAAIFARRLPKYIFYITVLLFVIVETLFASYYSINNPPTWILDIF